LVIGSELLNMGVFNLWLPDFVLPVKLKLMYATNTWTIDF